MDLYVHPDGGPRWIQCALGGRVEIAQVITPLDADAPVTVLMLDPANPVAALSTEVYPAGTHFCMEHVDPLGEAMLTAILRAEDGNSYGFTHSDNIQTGYREPWQNIALTSNSGIRGLCNACGFDCRAHHTHFFGWLGHGPMPPGAGTHPAKDLLAKLGWRLVETLPRCASPAEYQACRVVAGRYV